MAVRRDKEARDGGFHWHDTWLIARKEDEHGEAAFFWTGTDWGPWDSDAQVFEIRKEAENLMAGFVLTDPDPDRRNYRLELNSEQFPDRAQEHDACKWCAEKPWQPPDDLDITETLKDGQKRKPYDEGSVPDRKPE